MSSDVLDQFDGDDDLAIGDRVILNEEAIFVAGHAGVITGINEWATDVYDQTTYIVMTDYGVRVDAFRYFLIKSPYQGEKLEEVPNV